jgi:hypothetical protein
LTDVDIRKIRRIDSMRKSMQIFGFFTFLAVLTTAPVLGDTVHFTLANYGSDDINVVVAVSDNTPNQLSFTVSIVPTGSMPNSGDLLGVAINFGSSGSVMDVSNIFSTSDFLGSDITDIVYNTTNGGSGNNLNGISVLPSGSFSVYLSVGDAGSSSGLLTTTTFTIDTTGTSLGLEDVFGIGVRAQSVGSPPGGGEGSAKLYYGDRTTTVPEPSGLLLLAVGSITVCLTRRLIH